MHQGDVNGAVFSQDDTHILTWSADDTARVWDSGSGQALTPPLEHEEYINGAVFSQDETRILTWSDDDTARVWDSSSGEALTPPLEHQNDVDGAVFSQDDTHILTWGGDDMARVWDLQADDDFPRKHLILQVEVQTDTRLSDVGDFEVLSPEEWWEKKRQYEEIAQKHLTVGKYPRANKFLNALMNRPESCERPEEWMQEVNPNVVAEAASKYAAICLKRGNFYLNKKNYERAVRAFETALQLQTASENSRQLAEAYERLARTLIESGQDVEKGIEYAQKSLELNPHQQPDLALHTLALGYHQKGQNVEAGEAYLNLGRAYTIWKEYVSALNAYQQALRLYSEIKGKIIPSEYAEVLNRVLRGYKEQKKYDEVVREYERAIQYGFDDLKINARLFNRLAWTLIDQDIDIDKGVAYAQKSLELDPDQNPELAMNTLALGYIKQGRHAKAVELLKHALEKAPDDESRQTLQERMQQAQEGSGK